MPKSGNPLTVAEVAAMVGRDRKTILRWIEAGRLDAVKLAGRTGAYLIDPADAERLAEVVS